ncbi:MAG TPA: lysylphosphatidylglycerol synthase transmembrane domain-containing protein [Kofleriaceae bacterium]
MGDADLPREQHRISHVFNVAMLVFGAGALVWMLFQIGWSELGAVVASVGSRFAIVLGLDLAAVLLDAKALHAFLRPEARMISYWRVVAAQVSGRAVNVVTPFGALGEATKLTMLVTRAPRVRVLSAIVLFNLAGLYLSVAVMLIGTPLTLLLVDLPHALEVTVAVGLAVLTPLVVLIGALVRRGALGTLTGLLYRVRLISAARRDAWRARLEKVDHHIAELHGSGAAGTWRGTLWLVASRLVTWTSTMMLIHAVGVAITPHLVIGVLSVGALIAWIASVVPFGLGLADGGNYALFGLLGAPGADGAFVTMLNRARSFAVALVGFAVMAVVHTENRLALARLHTRLRNHREHAPGG